jgi:hypothetical protein
MKKFVLLALVCILSIGITQSVSAQNAKKVTVKGVKAAKHAGADPNIKQDRPSTDVVKEKSRGNCSVDFYNHTGYTINVYMDGVFWGTLAPYASGNVTDGSGYTKIYCVTVGGTYSWSASGNCDHKFQYDLTIANSN